MSQLVASTIAITGLVFGLDLVTPTGVAIGVLYFAPVLLTIRSSRHDFTIHIAGLSSLLILFEYILSPPSAAVAAYAIANRLLALTTVWLTVFLIMKYRRGAAAKARLAALVNSSDDAIISKTLEGTIESWNKGAERLYGYQAEEVVGRPITLLTPPDRQEEPAAVLTRLKNGQHIHRYETVQKRKNGQLCHVAMTISPIIDEAGVIVGASTIASDITEHKHAEEERARLLTDLKEAMANVKHLEGLLSVCAACKKIRDNQGEWVPFEKYIREHSEADFSHGLCPACLQRMQQLNRTM